MRIPLILESYLEISQNHKIVPLHTKIMGDGLTPVMVYQKLKELCDYSYLLESVQQDEKLGRFSFIGTNPLVIIQSQGEEVTITKDGESTTKKANPFEVVISESQQAGMAQLPELQDIFKGSLVGYFGYDTIRHIEKIPDNNPDELELPESLFILPRTVVIFDNITTEVTLIELAQGGSEAHYIEGCKKLKQTFNLLNEAFSPKVSVVPTTESVTPTFTSNMTAEEFKEKVVTAKEYIKEGDIFQVVVSQRFCMDYSGDSFEIYRSLRRINPSPYLYFLKQPGFEIAGSSPEILVKKEDRTLTLRPIAGTRKRGKTTAEDQALAADLMSDPKEVAEHMMLVDLGRNDLGRVAKFGTVKPTRFQFIENYSHVMHIVTNLTAETAEGVGPHEVLMSAFPAGTLSGAPKIRAMEIIDELEVTKRGCYGGTIMHLDFLGNLDSCIIIRTVIIKDSKAYIQAGAGVVADSVPEMEHEECLNKARAVMKAVALSQEIK